MARKNIRLEAIDPLEIYGAANKNLEALCRTCHGEEHGRRRRYNIAQDGSVTARA